MSSCSRTRITRFTRIIDVYQKAVPRKLWPIQLAFLLFLLCIGYSSSAWLCNFSFLSRSVELIFSVLFPGPHFKTFHLYVPVTYVKCNGTAKGPWFDSCPGTGIFLFFKAYSPVLVSTQPVMGRVQLKRDGTRWRALVEVKGKLANGVGILYPSHYLGTWCIQHYYRWYAHLGCQ